MKFIVILCAFFLVPCALWAQTVVASTSWTGAVATLAGADQVEVLAPHDLLHPPEYELRPSDLRTVALADFVVYAGYETMVERLLEAAGNSDAESIRITTTYALPELAAAVRTIAEKLGTESIAETRLRSIESFYEEWKSDIVISGINELPILVHFHQRGLAEELGLRVVGVFGPGPLEARQIARLSGARPAFIIDNGHNQQARPLAETTGATTVVWWNFPGHDATRTVLDVLTLNRRALQFQAR